MLEISQEYPREKNLGYRVFSIPCQTSEPRWKAKVESRPWNELVTQTPQPLIDFSATRKEPEEMIANHPGRLRWKIFRNRIFQFEKHLSTLLYDHFPGIAERGIEPEFRTVNRPLLHGHRSTGFDVKNRRMDMQRICDSRGDDRMTKRRRCKIATGKREGKKEREKKRERHWFFSLVCVVKVIVESGEQGGILNRFWYLW